MPSFASALVEGIEMTPEEEDLIKWTLVSVYMGGADTVSIHAFWLFWSEEGEAVVFIDILLR
jgi:hypothetical protein